MSIEISCGLAWARGAYHEQASNEKEEQMIGFFRHILFLILLAVVCYGIAILFTDSQLGFIVFFVVGIISELLFWILFWRQRKDV